MFSFRINRGRGIGLQKKFSQGNRFCVFTPSFRFERTCADRKEATCIHRLRKLRKRAAKPMEDAGTRHETTRVIQNAQNIVICFNAMDGKNLAAVLCARICDMAECAELGIARYYSALREVQANFAHVARFGQSAIECTQFFCKTAFVCGNPPGMQSHRKLDEGEICSLLQRSCRSTERSLSGLNGCLSFRLAGIKRAAKRLFGVLVGRAEVRLSEIERAAKRPFGISILARGNRRGKDERPGTLDIRSKIDQIQNEPQMEMGIGKLEVRCLLRLFAIGCHLPHLPAHSQVRHSARPRFINATHPTVPLDDFCATLVPRTMNTFR